MTYAVDLRYEIGSVLNDQIVPKLWGYNGLTLIYG